MDWATAIGAIRFGADRDENISIGGGEPTLHPRFFNILERCLDEFDYVWMATNGSKTNSMYRLSNILEGCDYESFECTCGLEDCECDYPVIYQEGKLGVALSQDEFHSPIDQRIVSLWHRKANQHKHSGYEIRDATRGGYYDNIAAQGRAKKNGYTGKHCVCPGIVIKPDGKLRLCGCTKSPVIGDIWSGITEYWENVINYDEDGYRNDECFLSVTKNFKLEGDIS